MRYHALVPNLQGLERAVAARVDVVAVFTAASETFSSKNTNASIADTLERFAPVIAASPVPVRGYVSTAFVCPFEGPVAPAMVRQVAIALTALGCQEISLGDTIGKATPDQVRRLLEIVLPDVPADRIALHCHDTFGQAVANVLAAAELGVRVFDGSAGGIGGCPYAPGAPGNVSTEALVRAFPGATGVDPEALAAAGRAITTAIQESGTQPVTTTRQPLVSVIVPTYNYGRYIAEALASILAQTVSDLEVIVVDDGSTDDTQEVLRRVTDPRVRVVQQEHAGTAAARNRGQAKARGQFIAWLDADDLWRPTFLERQLAVLEAEPEVGFCFANFIRTEGGVVIPGTQFDLVPRLRQLPTRPARGGLARVIEMDPFAALAPSTSLPGWLQASVFRRAALEGRWFNPELKSAEDLYLILQVYASGMPVAFIDEVLVEVRRHGKNSYTSGDYIQNGVLRNVLLFNASVSLTPSQQAILHRRISAEYCALGWRHFWKHDAVEAARFYARALRWPGGRLTALAHLAMLPILPLLPRREPAF